MARVNDRTKDGRDVSEAKAMKSIEKLTERVSTKEPSPITH
jgi:hypothetical protein